MSLGTVKKIIRRLGVRLALIFSGLFLFSSAVAFAALYIFLSQILVRNDRNIIEAKWKEYESILNHGDMSELKKTVEAERLLPGDIPLLVQVLSQDESTIFLKLPGNLANQKPVDIESALKAKLPSAGWAEIQSPYDEDRIDLYIHKTTGGLSLRVGKSSETREDLLEDLLRVFILVALGAAVIGSCAGIFFSNRALLPLRRLLSTIKEIQRGSLSARVPEVSSGDEMEEISLIFNLMLDRIERLVRGMKDTLDNVAHDIRTPMARLKAIAEIQLRAVPYETNSKEALEQCAESADEITGLLSSLLDLAEAESGTLRLEKQATKIIDLLCPVLEIYEVVAEEKQIRFRIENVMDSTVLVDCRRMKQALGNLVDNAIKYSPVDSEIKIVISEIEFRPSITISNEGPGIDVEDLPRIWDRLFRADRSRTERGLGIGLSIVKAIIEAHGGQVSASSQTGELTSFVVNLPKSI